MHILAIEGALARCSVALLADDRVIAWASEDTARGHAAVLPVLTTRVLAEAAIAAMALDAVAVGIGPGGFTGLRAAIALASGLAVGAGCRLVGVSTGEALVAALLPDVAREGPVWAVLDNRRGGLFVEFFPPGAAMPDGPPGVFDAAALPWPDDFVLLIGDAAASLLAHAHARGFNAALGGPMLPDAIGVARVAMRRIAGAIPDRAVAPLYVEPPAVRQPA